MATHSVVVQVSPSSIHWRWCNNSGSFGERPASIAHRVFVNLLRSCRNPLNCVISLIVVCVFVVKTSKWPSLFSTFGLRSNRIKDVPSFNIIYACAAVVSSVRGLLLFSFFCWEHSVFNVWFFRYSFPHFPCSLEPCHRYGKRSLLEIGSWMLTMYSFGLPYFKFLLGFS